MKIIALGDTHGRTVWKKIVAKENFDKVVFVGDYFDTHEYVTPAQQKRNFEDIIAYKEVNKDKVVLLIGNHDFHYLSDMDERYSGFNRYHAANIEQLLLNALQKDYLQMCFYYEPFLFVHAGITKTWCRNALGNDSFKNNELLAQTINQLFNEQPGLFRFTPGKGEDAYGDEVEQSPIWVRPDSLLADRVDNCTQIVGHTTQYQLVPDSKVTFIDALGTSGEYLCITDGYMQVHHSKRWYS